MGSCCRWFIKVYSFWQKHNRMFTANEHRWWFGYFAPIVFYAFDVKTLGVWLNSLLNHKIDPRAVILSILTNPSHWYFSSWFIAKLFLIKPTPYPRWLVLILMLQERSKLQNNLPHTRLNIKGPILSPIFSSIFTFNLGLQGSVLEWLFSQEQGV